MTKLFMPIEAARRLKLDRITIYRWIKAGRIKAKRLPSGHLCIGTAEINKILKG